MTTEPRPNVLITKPSHYHGEYPEVLEAVYIPNPTKSMKKILVMARRFALKEDLVSVWVDRKSICDVIGINRTTAIYYKYPNDYKKVLADGSTAPATASQIHSAEMVQDHWW